MKRIFLLILLVPVFVFAESLYSPTWGFFIDLPEGYDFIDGDGRDRFSFKGPSDAMFDLLIYNGRYRTIKELTEDINKRLGNKGEVDFYSYHNRQAAIIKLTFDENYGWGFCVELDNSENRTLMMLALAYSPQDSDELELLHISALDSICPSAAERRYPGPVIEYSYPRGEMKPVVLAGGINALIREKDAEAAQSLIEREFTVLKLYAESSYWQNAWTRYYRLVYRDSFDRITNPVFALARNFGGYNANTAEKKKDFAQRALDFVQGFEYKRNLNGSDFVNLVSAVTERSGDCDSRSMLWAIILIHADIRASMMVSPQYSHAMGLADIEGNGARFEHSGAKWLVAETTANVDIGLINIDQSDSSKWIGILFE
ncbi:MAG: hypothetical protein LBC76_07445 [Treponema sp.]|jgi:hypothetical protein|nr:hypothetical protein [Treponema sp.]